MFLNMILISLVFLPKITHSSQTYNQRMIYYICYYVHDINQAFSPSKLHGTAAAMAARRDGRAANQLRPPQMELRPLLRADGSARFCFGDTAVPWSRTERRRGWT
jgi:hypothetical protein